MNAKPVLFSLLLAALFAGCSQPGPTVGVQAPQAVEYRVRLAEFAQYDGPVATSRDGGMDPKWEAAVSMEAAPEGRDPADYGANQDGEFWQDTIIEAKSYHLEADAAITTHTHGIVIFATQSITIDGRINVRGLGAQPQEPGYSATRAGTLALYRGYGETDEASGEPLLWGAGGPDCNGGGYVILRAPEIILNGVIDAGSDCGQGGIVYLEGNTTGSGVVTANLIIHRGDTA